VGIKHGMYGTPIYATWARILRRFRNPNDIEYHNYGGRGIKVCKEWENFQSFYESMGEHPGKGFSIDRIDSNGDYTALNCKWSDTREQAINQRVPKNNSSGFTGVHFCKSKLKWIARFNNGKERINLGGFDTLEEAILYRYHAEDTSDMRDIYQNRRNKLLLDITMELLALNG